MRETNTSMAEYLGFYNTAWDELMAYEARPESTLREYGNRSVRTTWAISFEGVKRKNEDAAKMLQVWSYLDNRDIWFEVFNNNKNTDLKLWSDPPKWFCRVIRDKLSFKGVAATLLAYSLIEARQDSESYGVHPVVHEWCKQTVTSDRQPELAFLAITSVAFGVPHPDDRGSWPTQRRLLQHANRFSQHLMDMLEEAFESEQAIELYYAFSALGGLYQDGGQRMWVDAEAAYCRAISGYEKSPALHQARILNTQVRLARLYTDQGRLVDAEALTRRVLASRTESLGLDHRDTMGSMFHLATVLSRSNKLAEADNLYQFLLMRSQHLSYNTDFLFAALGSLYIQQGKLTESEAMYLQAIAGYKMYLETDHPRILQVRYNLGILYEQDNRLVEAEATMHQVSEISKKVFGVDHEKTLHAMSMLGHIFDKQGNFAEAGTVLQQALAGFRLVLGPEHELTLCTLDSLALCYFKQDNSTEAEALLLQCVDTFKYIPDEQKTSTQLRCIQNLGYIYMEQGRLAESEAMFQQALTGYRRVLDPEHDSTLSAFKSLGICYEDQGKFAEAELLLLECLESFKHIADDQRTSPQLDCINSLGVIYARQARFAEAEAMFQQASTGYRRVFGSEHELTLRTLRNLRICYQRQGKFDEAAALSVEDTNIERVHGHSPTTKI